MPEQDERGVYGFLNRIFYQRATAVIAVSSGVKYALLKLYPFLEGRIHLLRTAADHERLSQLARE